MRYSAPPVVGISAHLFEGPHPEPGYLDDLVAEMKTVSGPVDKALVDEMTVRYFK